MPQSTDQILTRTFAIHQSLFNHNRESQNQLWKNHDNWSFGPLGGLFFALELYSQTKDPAVWTGMMHRLEQLEQSIAKKTSANYALLYGKTGLAHFYIRLFQASGRKEFAARALDLVQDCLDPEWWSPLFEKTSLAEGISGFLLFSLSFFQATGMSEMAGVAERLTGALIDQARMADNGVFWPGNGSDDRTWCGMAYGGSGIALALLQLATATADDQLLRLGEMAINFDCLHASGDPGLFQGEAGKQLVRLYYDRLNGNTDHHHWKNMVHTMTQSLNNCNSMGMSNGLAGWGIALLDGALVTRNHEERELADRIGMLLLSHLNTAATTDLSFSTGLAGIGYFLLRWNCPDKAGHLPFVMDLSPGLTDNYHRKPPIPYHTALLQKAMPGTLRLLQELHPAEAGHVLSGAPVLPADLMGTIRKLVTETPASEKEKLLLSTAKKECFDTSMQKCGIMRVHSGDEEFKASVTTLYNTPEKRFMDLRLQVSGNIEILDLDEHAAINVQFAPDDLKNLLYNYGLHTFWYTVDRYGSIESKMLGLGKLFCFLFAERKTVKEALDQLLTLVNQQQQETALALAQALGGGDSSQLSKLLKEMMRGAIPTLIMTGVLRVH